MNERIFAELAATLEQRKHADAEQSYVAALYARGVDAILKKIGEEATELVIAAKGVEHTQIVAETADLWFHTLVLLAAKNIDYRDVFVELERRSGVSGLEEKASRKPRG